MNAAASRSRTSLLFSRPLLAIMLATGTMASWPIIDGSNAPVLAQASVSVEFRTALQPYGRWERHSHWGQVWVPENRPRGWRPYTVGHWAYTDDWGWYWVSDQVEDDWGWIVYHYGHWAFDGDLGWIWVPGDEWGPGWVAWRRGAEYIGWAPLAPDADVEVIDQPNVWVFVRKHDFVAPRIADVIVPEREFANVIRDTVVVNRTVNLRDRRFAVNPGIEPGIIAAAVGRPIHSFDVRPRVLAGTARIPGATEVRADQRGRRNAGNSARRCSKRSARSDPRRTSARRSRWGGASKVASAIIRRASPRNRANAVSRPPRKGASRNKVRRASGSKARPAGRTRSNRRHGPARRV